MSEMKQVICVRKDLNMRKGKLAAQVAHAAMMFLVKNAEIGRLIEPASERLWMFEQTLTQEQAEWLRGLFTKIVVSIGSEAELLALIQQGRNARLVVHEVHDSGLTEFHGVVTLTCAAFGPGLPEKLDPITGHLPLL